MNSFLHGLAVYDEPAGPVIIGKAIELISKVVEKYHSWEGKRIAKFLKNKQFFFSEKDFQLIFRIKNIVVLF